ncbi:MAG TPA: FAD-binding and (Fe-S)-binding domain-containing protein [Flavitalea sp.]|nr:FAD-binding and (Fe-S)-binding domain-containing protein [Flavitalea sp.]
MKDIIIEKELLKIIPAERIKSRYIDRVTYGADAGFYFLLPKAIVKPVCEQEIILLFEFSRQFKIPLVFRTGGTSLSGQSVTDGILVDISQHWNKISIEQLGDSVRVQPGITGGMVNAYLKKRRKKIGPDPSSIGSAMMGGIISNNASGMCCGVKLNSYHTMKYIRFILPDGKTFSTEKPEDYNRFEKECALIYTELLSIKKEIIADAGLFEKIRKKYTTKNTVGYSLNALIDHDHPLDILSKLLVGAEGTLAFISEAVMNTVPDYEFKSTALLYYSDIYAACQAIVPLRNAGAEAVELMDRSSLRSIELLPGMPALVKTLPPLAAALLVEFQDNKPDVLQAKVKNFLSQVSTPDLLYPPVFTSDNDEQAFLWKVRKGLFPAVGAVRLSGTSVILEDLAFPVNRLGDAIIDLQKLFHDFGYYNAIIFGHAKDGNLHFVITQSFNEATEVDRYDKFMRQVVKLVVSKYEGTLKAEHGTGRNMAPFVETEWGSEAYTIMKRLKKCIDPFNLLNPGVIINEDPNVHIKNLKELPTVEEEVDKCIECGYCEHVCPSRDITTTPRRRIIARRELKRLEQSGKWPEHKILTSQFEYDVMDTCAVDGLCANACPVDINTGDLVKRLRTENHSPLQNAVALVVAKNFALLEFFVRTGINLKLNQLSGNSSLMKFVTLAPSIPKSRKNNADVIYFPSCVSRIMGGGIKGKKNVMETFISICNKTGLSVNVPRDIKGSCCSQIFSSKGYRKAHEYKANEIIERLWKYSGNGKIPVVTDVSSCAYTLIRIRPVLTEKNKVKYDQLQMLDSVEFLHDTILPKVKNVNKKETIVVHPVCSLEKMGTWQKFIATARFFGNNVMVPAHAGCCGMAGDRGFLFPELTDSATYREATEVKQITYNGYYSSTKTCEIAMSHAVGKDYESILYLADECI